MSIITSVHLRIVRCHQFKKRHHIWLLSKVFAELEKVVSLKWRCTPWEAFHWWRREHSADPAVRPTVECSVGVIPGQEGTVLRIKRIFGVSRSRLTQIIRPIWKVQSQSIESKDIKWRHLVLVRVPALKLLCDAPTNQFLALWQLWERKE